MARSGGGPKIERKDRARGPSARMPGSGRQPRPRQPGSQAEEQPLSGARFALLNEPSDYPIPFEPKEHGE